MREWVLRLWGTFRHTPTDSDLERELAFHLEMAEQDLRREGHAPREAARLARLRVGRYPRAMNRLRDQRGFPWLGKFSLDVVLALRMLRKNWGLTLVGGLAMTVGFGIVTFLFMYLDTFVWASTLPLEDGEDVVAIQIWDPEARRRGETRIEDFERWGAELRSLEHLGGFRTVEHQLTGSDGTGERVTVAEVSAAGFRVARATPALGRILLPEDEDPGAEPVIVIGYDEWQRWFDGDDSVLGETLRLDDEVRTIVGVMPEDFGFPINHRLWIPLQADSADVLPAPPAGAVFGRLAPGTSLETARAELSATGLLPSADATRRDEPLRPTVVRYADNFISDTDPDDLARKGWNARIVLFMACLLLIPPCVNIAMLAYARMVTRQEEIAVRTALGASRSRIVAQLFIEMLALTTIAAGLALVAVRIAAMQLERLYLRELQRLPFWVDFDLSPGIVAFAGALAIAAALVVGLLPALKTTARFSRPGLGALDARYGARLGPIWTALVVVQIAFSFAALPSAAELAWGVLRAHVLGPGFAAGEYLVARLAMDVDPADAQPAAAARFDRARAELVRRLEADPRVRTRVTAATAMPGEGPYIGFELEESADADGTTRQTRRGLSLARTIRVDENYFEVFDVPILIGRAFRAGDFGESSRSVIVNETFAHKALDGANPVGRRIRYYLSGGSGAGSAPEMSPWYEIVGVAADRPSHPHSGSVFHPRDRAAIPTGSIGFRVGADTASLREQLRAMAGTSDASFRISEIRTLQELYDAQAVGNYFGGVALIAGSLSVLLLSAAGTYALMSFTVNRRRREIGIRLALGARPRQLLTAIFRRALRQVALGAVAGLLAALFVQSRIPIEQLGGWELPGVLPSAVVFILMIGVVSAVGPVRRMLAVEPTQVLRDEGGALARQRS